MKQPARPVSMAPLLATPQPFPTESLFGYVLRLTEANGYDSTTTILSHMDATHSDVHTSASFLDRLAEATGALEFSYPELSYRDHAFDGIVEHMLLGKAVTYSHRISPFNHEQPKLCAQCVEDKGHIEAFWDLRFAVACPAHGTVAVRSCTCGKNLSWKRRNLTTCGCGKSYRSVAAAAAPLPVVMLMKWLAAKLNGSAAPESPENHGFPARHLVPLSLQSLLVLIQAFSEFTAPSRRENKLLKTFDAVNAAAELLQDWPRNFEKALSREQLNNVSGPRKNTTGFSRRFVRTNLLLGNLKLYPDLAFVSEAYFEYGRNEWDGGIVDERTDGVSASAKRFVSLQGAAISLGVSTTTLSKWRKAGVLSATGVKTDKAVRYVVDKNAVATLKKPLVKPVHAKEAAAYLGLPLSVLYRLREVGALKSTQPVTRARSFYLADLDLFRDELCNKSPWLMSSQHSTENLSFSHVMNRMKLCSRDGKADFVVAYLEGAVKPLGRTGEALADIFFDAAQVKRFATEKRNKGLADSVAQTIAADELECPWRTIPVLIENGLLMGIKTTKGVRVASASLAAFKAAYASLNSIATRFDTTSKRLAGVIDAKGLEMLKIPGKPPFDRLYFTSRKNLEIICKCFTDVSNNLPE